ncbi:MAG: asparagine synthase-related protein [Alphaproteobacteria bacterium]
MSGIVFCAGSDALARCEAMINPSHNERFTKSVLAISDSWACGKLWSNKLVHEKAPVQIDELMILLDGELYKKGGPELQPEAIFYNLYRQGNFEQRVTELNGSFAGAVIDSHRGQITFFNDRLGTRTLFFAEISGQLLASTKPLYLLADPTVSRQLNRQAFFEMLSFRRICSNHTLYTGIQVMPGGSVWRWFDNKLSRKKVWKLNWKTPDFSLREAPEIFATHLVHAGENRLSEYERGGILLSGGIDSRLVLAATQGAGHNVSCLTLGPFDNREVGVARSVASAAKAPFRYIPNPPEALIETFDEATIAAQGTHVTPFTFFRRLPELAVDHDVLFSGHALDIAFRGFYLPCRTFRIGKGSVRTPLLGGIKKENLPDEMIRIWRASTPLRSLQKVLDIKLHPELMERQRQAAIYALTQADIQDPYNALEAFAFHTQSLHYTWSDFIAMETVIRHRALCFDKDLFDFCRSLPPLWRAQGEIPRRALKLLAPALTNELDANTGYPLRWNGWQHISAMLLRSGLQKLKLWPKRTLPTGMATHGSWANLGQLLRLHPGFRERLNRLYQDPALLDTGILSSSGIKKAVEEHLSNSADHRKLLHTLLSMSTWFRAFPYTSV